MTYRKKLIEVALPLEEINKQSAREKSIRHGHPCTLHLWWARRPLAACRAVLFSSLVDDPGEYLPEEKARAERERLFRLIEQLVNWDNIQNEKILGQARLEIAKSVARNLGIDAPKGDAAIRQFLAEKAPPVLDPFCGGGSIPLEAQRLGLRAYASDLNPVAVLITKALIEIPPKFVNQPPFHPPEEGDEQTSFMERDWKGAQGLAEDVRYYGKWMREEAEKQIGSYYPKVKLSKELIRSRSDLREQGLKAGNELAVIAWLWARTIQCPNPTCKARMPLMTTLWLSKKKGNLAWLEPVINRGSENYSVTFIPVFGKSEAPSPSKIGRGAKFKCLVCDQIASEDYLRNEFISNRHSYQLVSIVVDTPSGRTYLPSMPEQIDCAERAKPLWEPLEEMNSDVTDLVSGRGYGVTHWRELFTPRQLLGLTTLVDLLNPTREKIIKDMSERIASIAPDKNNQTSDGYEDAVITILGMAVSRLSDISNSSCRWENTRTQVRNLFSRQAIPMVWDFAEANLFSEAAGDYLVTLGSMLRVIERSPITVPGVARQADANDDLIVSNCIISTDPPYYDNINYADLSDFFYIWLRASLRTIYPELFATVLVPKEQELIAAPYRFKGDAKEARVFFESGLSKMFRNSIDATVQGYPVTVFYAYKQSEEKVGSGQTSTGWETMLESLIKNGYVITGTWPIRTELINRPLASGTNALASSIVLSCRQRSPKMNIATRREFVSALQNGLPKALLELQQISIAPVDLAQAVIGPGMSIFSRYSSVLEADGSSMPVRIALALINQVMDEFLTEQESEIDPDTRWAVAWFEQYGHKAGPFGDAETLSKAKNTSTDGLVNAGILEARAGKVRLLERNELDPNWDPGRDKRLTTWEATQYLILALEKSGETEASALLRRLGGVGLATRELAYRLYSICERKGWAQGALAYNMLATAWPRLMELGQHEPGLSQDQLL